MVFGGDAGEAATRPAPAQCQPLPPAAHGPAGAAGGGPGAAPAAAGALDALEEAKGFARLPGLFAMQPGDAEELAYLDDALGARSGSICDDQPGGPAAAVDHRGWQISRRRWGC